MNTPAHQAISTAIATLDVDSVQRTIDLLQLRNRRDPDPRRERMVLILCDLQQRLTSGRVMTAAEVGSALGEITQYLALIEQSSLGTSGARHLRHSISLALVDDVLARTGRVGHDGPPDPQALERIRRWTPSEDPVPDMPTLHAAAEYLLDSLVESAVRGDPTATEWLLHHVRPQVEQYCAVRVPAESVDQIAQEVLLTLFQALPTYRNQGRPFLAFVLGIANHKVTTLQHEHRDPHPGDRSTAGRTSWTVTLEQCDECPDVVPTLHDQDEGHGTWVPTRPPHQQLDQPEHQIRTGLTTTLQRMLSTVLTPRERDIVLLRVVAGLTTEHAADRLGITPAAVRTGQHRALRKLRKVLQL